MVLPHRGQMEPPEAQVVPQWEQVLTLQELQGRLALCAEADTPPSPPQSTSVNAQEDWGNSGREKNSFQKYDSSIKI